MESATSNGILDDPIKPLVDRAKSFEQAADLLQDGGMAQSLATEMVALSGVANQGTTIEEACSTGGAIHRAWMNFKHAATGADVGAVLAAAETGEGHAVTDCDDALEKDGLPEDVREVIARQAQRNSLDPRRGRGAGD